MSIRSRLLMWLLPVLIAFVGLISCFFYLNWYWEILSSFEAHLKSIVASSSELFDPDDIAWLNAHRNDPDIAQSPAYERVYQKLWHVEEKVPTAFLYIVSVESVKKGETVLLDQPTSETNKVYDGIDKNYAYREVYLIDVSAEAQAKKSALSENIKGHKPGDMDFTEPQEQMIYFTKETLATSIYKTRDTQQRYMSAYAPIFDRKGNVIALVAADVAVGVIDQELSSALTIIAIAAMITIFLATASMFFIADKISQPVKALKNAALSIAAGEYGEKIQVNGPREIVELANTLNTMSECLDEHITRLRESSVARERLYGEYECSLLLQDHMLYRVIEDWKNPHVSVQLVKVVSSTPSSGLLLRLQEDDSQNVHVFLAEVNEPGFKGMYDLLSQGANVEEKGVNFPHIQAKIGADLSCNVFNMPHPLVWSLQEKAFATLTNRHYKLHSGDVILLCNRGFAAQFSSSQFVQEWLGKVLRHFGSESLDSFTTILSRELDFLANKQHTEQDLYILCLKVS